MQQRILKRKHISEALNNIFGYPLTVVVAAMGYGKTTSIRDFLTDTKVKYNWVSVDSDQSSLHYLWDSLTRQLAKCIPELGSQLRALGFPVDTPQRDRILKIIEDHVYMTNTILVVDDYHFAHFPEFDRLIEKIVRAKITGFHILIISRTVPEMNIEELTLKGYCYMLKSNLFEFSKDEIKEYFKLYGYNLSEDIVGQIYEMSEGWVSAIYLIMQRYAEIGRLEPGRSIERLIATTVMSRYTDSEMMLLKSLSILDSFTSQQAVYVTGIIEAEKIIQKISSMNSFIRYDEHEDVYRIHNIFNSYLRKLFTDQLSEININELYQRAGQWHILNEDIIEGFRYLIKAKEYDLILYEFAKNSINLVLDNNPRYITELFERIPIEVKYRHPIGYLAYIGFYVTNVDKKRGVHLLAEIELYYRNDNHIPPELKKRICGEIELIRAYTGFNDAALMREKLAKAHGILKGCSSIANKDKIITFGSPHSLYLYYREKGKLLWTRKCVEEMFPYYSEMASGCGKGFDCVLQAEYHLEIGNISKAEQYAYKAVYKARSFKQVSIIICAQLVLARVAAAKGKFNEILEIMDDLREEVDSCNSTILSSAFDLCEGYMGGITGKDAGFAKWLREGDMGHSEVLYEGMGFNYIIYGKYLLLKKDYLKLEVLCEEMLQNFSSFNNLLGYLHTYILDAVAKYKLYGMEVAKTVLITALDIGKADRIIMPIVEYGSYILKILKEIQKETKKDDYLDKLVYYASKYSENMKKMEDAESIIPILTNREKEILGLIVEGKTNREIASEIFIAEVTVRKNITSIYRKIGVNGRTIAVKKALELKIL